MKKNNEGFTLIEVLAVIILMSVIGMVAIPNLIQIQNQNKTRVERSTKLLIENAAKIYVANYKEEVNKRIEKSTASPKNYCVPIGKLKAYDFLNINSDEVNISNFNNTCIKITKTTVNGKVIYNYDYQKNTYTVSASEDYIPPVISVQGASNCSVEMTASSLDDFYNSCQVVSDDRKDGRKTLKPIDIKENAIFNKSTNQTMNLITLTYEDEDAAGNQAKNLKVTLTIPNNQ